VKFRPGCRLVVAPMFHLQVDWGRRLLVGNGSDGAWRAPDAAELASLLPDEFLPIPREALTDCLCLFRLPQHLRAASWRLLETASATGTLPAAGFDAFAGGVGRFVALKEMPPPDGAVLELLVSNPGLRRVPGLNGARPLWAAINLGDEATSLVIENSPCHALRVRLTIEPGEGCRLPGPRLYGQPVLPGG
jgi:hypothetical protein